MKGWSYAERNKDCKCVISFVRSDIDKCGHLSENVIIGVKKSFERIQRLVPGIVCISSEGDAGGGESVQSTFAGFKETGILVPSSRYINRLMHPLSCKFKYSRIVGF